MTVHELKCDPEPFDAIADGRKTVELRINDRAYAVDALYLRRHRRFETPFGGPGYTGQELHLRVTHVQAGYGLQPGYVALSFRRIIREEIS